jgi:hypothetical protein
MLLLVFVLINSIISRAASSGLTAGDKMVIQIRIDLEHPGICSKHGCSPQQLARIESHISARLTSNPFSLNVELSNGIFISISTIFLSFGSGKSCALQS